MRKLVSDSYRQNILDFFKEENDEVYDILNENFSNWRFPFNAAHRFTEDTDEKVDVRSFLSAALIFNKYKEPIRVKSSFKIPERSDRFIRKIIMEGRVLNSVNSFASSVFVAYNMLQKIIYDENFNWFMMRKIEYKDELYPREFIIVDTPNVHKSIIAYEGRNNSIIKLRDEIIRGRHLFKCLTELVDYMADDLNNNLYKFIFIVPNHQNIPLREDAFIITVDCVEYTGKKCSKEDLTNEVDDTLLLMLYDYCRDKYRVPMSIMSKDNYDFSIIAQDYSTPYDRAVFSKDYHSTIMNWEDIQYNYEGFMFNKMNPLTIFEENFDENF